MICVHVLPVLLNLDTCSVVSDSQKDNRSPGQLAGLWLQICGELAPCPDHPNAQLQVKPELWLITPQKPSITAAGYTDQLKISVKTHQRCVKREGRIRWVLTQAITACRADSGSGPCCVPLGAAAITLLDTVPRKRHCDWIFANPKKLKPYVSIFYSWNTARTAAGLAEVRVHDLRHSFASFLVNAGCSLYEVQKILGHSSVIMTQRYSHLSQDSLLRAASHAGNVVSPSCA